MAMPNAAGAQIALDFLLTGPNLTFCTACASSTISIGEAVRLIRSGEADAMLAGGSEALLTFGTIKAWEALRTLAEEVPGDPGASCRPFSKSRTGMVLGEGAAMVMLESLENAQARGAHIYAEVVGFASSRRLRTHHQTLGRRPVQSHENGVEECRSGNLRISITSTPTVPARC